MDRVNHARQRDVPSYNGHCLQLLLLRVNESTLETRKDSVAFLFFLSSFLFLHVVVSTTCAPFRKRLKLLEHKMDGMSRHCRRGGKGLLYCKAPSGYLIDRKTALVVFSNDLSQGGVLFLVVRK
jgi:hypothetical protein